jgi:hypothetical protein
MFDSSLIAALPATYGGVLFRSRTEARWAVFLDALGVRWEYEREGYALPCGNYLPDFWLEDALRFLPNRTSALRWPTQQVGASCWHGALRGRGCHGQ